MKDPQSHIYTHHFSFFTGTVFIHQSLPPLNPLLPIPYYLHLAETVYLKDLLFESATVSSFSYARRHLPSVSASFVKLKMKKAFFVLLEKVLFPIYVNDCALQISSDS